MNALRDLVDAKRVLREGKGGKVDPFRYGYAKDHGDQEQEQFQEPKNNRLPEGISHNFYSVVPPIDREQGNKNMENRISPQNTGTYSGSREHVEIGNQPYSREQGPEVLDLDD